MKILRQMTAAGVLALVAAMLLIAPQMLGRTKRA
jgi:hypothetical protein